MELRIEQQNSNIPIINPRKILLYIVYGDDQIYYDGAIFSILTFKYWSEINDKVEIFILTEKPEKFNGYPIKTFLISKSQKKEWSINNSYHFRIKNRGLAFIMDELKLKQDDKIICFDTDTFFSKSPMALFDLINQKQAIMYKNEGLIHKKNRFSNYVNNLKGQEIKIDKYKYVLSLESSMWGSLIIGIMPNMRPSLDLADKLMLEFFKLVSVHTIEQFSLSEALQDKYKVVEGKSYISEYSTSGSKRYAKEKLSDFFNKFSSSNFENQILFAQKVRLNRPILIHLKQNLFKLIKYFLS